MSGIEDVGVLCRRFDAAVVALEMAGRVVLRSEDTPAAKLERVIALMKQERHELCGLVRGATAVYVGHRTHAREDAVREAGERIACVQLVLANRMAVMQLAERVQGQLTRGETTPDEATAWGWHFFGLVSCDMPIEVWTDSLQIPADKPAVEA